MDDLDFSKILQDAEALSSEIESSVDMPRVQRNLRQVLEAGQHLLSRNRKEDVGPSAEAKASVFLGTKGVDISKMSKKLDPNYKVISSGETQTGFSGSDADVEGFLLGERNNIIHSILNTSSKALLTKMKENIRADLHAEWKAEKEKILTALSASNDEQILRLENITCSIKTPAFKSLSSQVLSKTEVTFSHEIDSYVKALIINKPKPNLVERFEIVANNTQDRSVKDMWASVSSLLSSIQVNSLSGAVEKRSSPRLKNTFILRARAYLEKTFFAKVQNDIWKSFGGPKLGGIPSVRSILKNYVSMRNYIAVPGVEIGPGDSGPIWAMVYIFLRSGQLNEAVNYLREEVNFGDFANILTSYGQSCIEGSNGLGLPIEKELEIQYEHSRIVRTIGNDPFKCLVYSILGGCDISNDHPEILTRLDDYLWVRLSQVRESPHSNSSGGGGGGDFVNKDKGGGGGGGDSLTYDALQDLISQTYGEKHFDAFKQPFVYFMAVFLTGQFEVASEFLYRISSLRSHGLHLAILLHELGLLVISDSASPPISRAGNDPPGIRRLNYCQLIVQYAKTFQGRSAHEALNYLYLLRNIKEKVSGVSLFTSCVADLALESKNFEYLFGSESSDGRVQGILQVMGINPAPILDHCAITSETSGMLEEAAILYDLAGKPEGALTVLNRLIGRHASRKGSEDSVRQRTQPIAVHLAEKYSENPPELPNKNISLTFYTLVDIMTFFDEFHAKHFENSLTIIEKMRLVPFEKEDIERCLSNFHLYADEVRSNIPPIILATMESLYFKLKKTKEERKVASSGKPYDDTLEELKSKAKTLVTFCGLIPYCMTGDFYSKVMQFDVQIN